MQYEKKNTRQNLKTCTYFLKYSSQMHDFIVIKLKEILNKSYLLISYSFKRQDLKKSIYLSIYLSNHISIYLYDLFLNSDRLLTVVR